MKYRLARVMNMKMRLGGFQRILHAACSLRMLCIMRLQSSEKG